MFLLISYTFTGMDITVDRVLLLFGSLLMIKYKFLSKLLVFFQNYFLVCYLILKEYFNKNNNIFLSSSGMSYKVKVTIKGELTFIYFFILNYRFICVENESNIYFCQYCL